MAWCGQAPSAVAGLFRPGVRPHTRQAAAEGPLPLDFVTVAFAADLPLLRLQARSMARYLDPDLCGQVIVIANQPGDAGLVERIAREVVPDYGALAPRVRLTDAAALRDLEAIDPRANGWRRQQVLKLEAHRLVGTEAYVTLDCKNHFIRPTSADAFLDPSGRLRMLPRGVQPRHAGAFDLFGLPPGQHPATMFHIITPFSLIASEVAAMDRALRARTGRGYAEAILAADGPRQVEYRLYCAFLVAERGGWEARHVLSDLPSASFFAREDQLAPVLRKADRPDTRMMAVHRRAAWCTPEEKAEIIRRWLAFGLIGDGAEGEAILTPPPGAKRPA